MLINFQTRPVHLTYCLNIHAGENWEQNFKAVRKHTCAVRDEVADGRAFGLGMRLGSVAAAELDDEEKLGEFRRFLESENLYVFTVNGFPYGEFHGSRVKEKVYAPDWQTDERSEYTKRLARIMAAFLPDGVSGSISTVPGTYRTWVQDTKQTLAAMGSRLAVVLAELHRLKAEQGRRITLALEPEPDCVFDSVEATLESWHSLKKAVVSALAQYGAASPEEVVDEHLGLCIDTCHQAVLFEDPAETIKRVAAAGIPVAKVQLSAAPRFNCTPGALSEAMNFLDPVYLHQTALRHTDGRVERFPDLRPALERAGEVSADAECRTHFHIPLSLERCSAEVGSTRQLLNREFFETVHACGCEHIEVETYTFDVLPPKLQQGGVVKNVAAELKWAKAQLES